MARHLGPLREDANRLVGDPGEAEHFYPEVLTDVAARWNWLELLRTRLNRPDAADEYLDRAFATRSQKWQTEQWELTDWSGHIEVWNSELAPRPFWSSAATRLAPQLRPVREATSWAPVAEASLAWWHAYEARRRNRRIAIVVVIVLLLAGLSRFTGDDSIDAYRAPARMIVAGIDALPSMNRGLPG